MLSLYSDGNVIGRFKAIYPLQALSGQYPRGYKELKGSFFRVHGPKETAKWFEDRGVKLKVMT